METKISSEYEKDCNSIQTDCKRAGNPTPVGTLLEDIMRAAVIAYPEELLENNAQIIATYRHKFCNVYIKSIQKSRSGCGVFDQLLLESSYYNKSSVHYSHAGSVRPDIYWPQKGYVFDFKFMGGSVRNTEVERWKEHLPFFSNYRAIREDK